VPRHPDLPPAWAFAGARSRQRKSPAGRVQRGFSAKGHLSAPMKPKTNSKSFDFQREKYAHNKDKKQSRFLQYHMKLQFGESRKYDNSVYILILL